jgi:hypothetical protein
MNAILVRADATSAPADAQKRLFIYLFCICTDATSIYGPYLSARTQIHVCAIDLLALFLDADTTMP